MLWFRHLSHAADDEKLSRLIEKNGLLGYGFYWRVVEIIAGQMGQDDKCFCTYSGMKWAKKAEIKPSWFRKQLSTCTQLGLFSVSSEDELLTISCPTLLRMRDEYTKRKGREKKPDQEISGECPDNDRSLSGNNKAKQSITKQNKTKYIYKEGECDEKIELKEFLESKFNDFWNPYPRKAKKQDAFKAFKQLFDSKLSKKKLSTRLTNFDPHYKYFLEVQLPTYSDKQYYPYPATWLRGTDFDNPPEAEFANDIPEDPQAVLEKKYPNLFNAMGGATLGEN